MRSKEPSGLLLFGLPNRALDAVATVVVASALVVSRFGFLANGPWEWDETLFARGILHFELAAHFPHPPGFPGWLAIGHLLTPLTGDPLLALQLASAAFSVAALWALAAIGRQVASPPVAAAAALALLAAPGPWLYAVRGFSTTAASVLALAAAAVLVGGLGGHRVTVFTLLVSASFLVRPHLLPALVVLWLAGMWSVRPLRRILPGVGIGFSAGVIAVLMMVRAEGGWSAFVAPFVAHSQRHFSRLAGNLGSYADLGLVKGLGGVLPATLLFSLAVAGLTVWARRRGRRSAMVWLLVLAVVVAQLVWLQNRTYGRYAVGAQMALAPLVAAAAATVPPTAAVAGLLGLTAWFGMSSLPLVSEQHTTQLPAWQAVQESLAGALEDGKTVVLESELHPFASYLWHLLESRGEPTPPWVLSPWDPEPWAGVDRAWLVATVHRRLYPDPLFGMERRWAGVSDALQPLTQQRFLEAWVLSDTPLPIRGIWPAERTAAGRRFMWGASDAVVELPPLAGGTDLGLTLRPAPGPDPVTVRWAGAEAIVVVGQAEETRLRLKVSPGHADLISTVAIERARGFAPGSEDRRLLAAQIFEMRAVDSGRSWTGSVAQNWQRDALQVELVGAFKAEVFAVEGEGVWLSPRAVLRVPAGAGTLRLRLWAPRPTPSQTVLSIGGEWALGPLDITPQPMEVEIDLTKGTSPDGRIAIEILSQKFEPAAHGLNDSRELGVVLSRVTFVATSAHLDQPQGGP
ncbi:MAG: hypothetical protein QNL88_00875 [Acidobacteriota bacterium]|nr:hypothetical protein [Acidobacteriota bacterium]